MYDMLRPHIIHKYRNTRHIIRVDLQPTTPTLDALHRDLLVSSGLDFRELTYTRIQPPGVKPRRGGILPPAVGCRVTHRPSGLSSTSLQRDDFEHNRHDAEAALAEQVAWWIKTKAVE